VHVVPRLDGSRRPAADPSGPVIAPEHLFGEGAGSAASAVEALARRGLLPGRAAASAESQETRARAAAFLDRLRADPTAGTRQEGFDVVTALASDPSGESTALLGRALRELRPADAHRLTLETAADALRARKVDLAPFLRAGLGGAPGEANLAAMLVRRARDPADIPVLREALSRPGLPARTRHEFRSLLIWLHAAALEKGGVEPDRLAAFAREVAGWVAEGGGAEGFASSLLDLGPPGEAQFEAGLRGKDRTAYLNGLARGGDRRVAAATIAAAVGPVGPTTSAEERHLALVAAFRAAPPDAEPALVALANRLSGDARTEALIVLRIVRHRAGR
jgi:hypothetical protein